MAIIKLLVGNDLSRRTVLVDSAKTPREVFTEEAIEIGLGALSLDGTILRPAEIDTALEEFGLNEDAQHTLVAVVKHDNAVTVTINGAAVVLKSEILLDELRKIKKYRPKKLILTDEKQNPLYMVDISNGEGSVSKNGAVFGEYEDAEGHATITLHLPEGVLDPKSWATEHLGYAILNIRKIEQNLASVTNEIDAEIADIESAVAVF